MFSLPHYRIKHEKTKSIAIIQTFKVLIAFLLNLINAVIENLLEDKRKLYKHLNLY